ncbi:MAG: ComF family protein, partial [Gammaproteobacteria bacterium]|nr:ComF family protein [Gammaproteobacteria bacterium]
MLCGGGCPADNICPGCLRDLPRNDSACTGCGLARAGCAQGLCGDCLARPPAWDAVHAPLRYEFPVDVLIHMLKYRRRLAAAAALARAMAPGQPQAKALAPVMLIPVPMHWSREWARGYNHAFELARALSRRSGSPLARGRLVRSRRTPPQTGLEAAARRRNLRGAFRWDGGHLDG